MPREKSFESGAKMKAAMKAKRGPKYSLRSLLLFTCVMGVGVGLLARLVLPVWLRVGWFALPVKLFGLNAGGALTVALVLASIPALLWLLALILAVRREVISALIFLVAFSVASLGLASSNRRLFVVLLLAALGVSVLVGWLLDKRVCLPTLAAMTVIWLAYWFLTAGFQFTM